MQETTLLRVNQVKDKLGISKSQVWHLTKIGELKSYSLSPRVTVWKLEDIENYISSKVA